MLLLLTTFNQGYNIHHVNFTSGYFLFPPVMYFLINGGRNVRKLTEYILLVV